MNKRKVMVLGLVCILLLAGPFGLFMQRSFAFSNDFHEKFLTRGFAMCYPHLKESFSESQIGGISAIEDTSQLFKKNFDPNEKIIGLPGGFEIDGDDQISCKTFFEYYGITIRVGELASADNVKSILSKLGYEASQNSVGCVRIKLTKDNGVVELSNLPVLCLQLDENDRVQFESNSGFKTYAEIHDGTECAPGVTAACDPWFTIKNQYNSTKGYFSLFDVINIGTLRYPDEDETEPSDRTDSYSGDEVELKLTEGNTWREVLNSFNSVLGSESRFGNRPLFKVNMESVYYDGYDDLGFESGYGVGYKKKDDGKSIAYNNLFGSKLVSDRFTFTLEEKSALYANYLNKLWGVTADCYDSRSEAEDANSSQPSNDNYEIHGFHLTRLYKRTSGSDVAEAKYCWVVATKRHDMVYGVVNASLIPMMVEDGRIGFEDTLNWMLENAVDEVSVDLLDGYPDSSDPGDGDGDEDGQQDGCWASGSGVGWVICPVLNFVGGALDTVYDYVEGFLRVDPKLFSDGNNTVYNAWNQFRNFANIIFVILLLFVIFSQLTGYGIDNYGIKKILPKLIVAAVLINLSYVICQICVDLSNIIGNGLQALFNSLSESLGELSINVVDDGSSIASGFSTGQKVLISSSLVAALIAGLVIVAVNPMVLISLLVAALGVLIGVLFLFVLLVARQAIVIILITISPIAFALNILPNTKKLFSKWVKIGEAMLLLYPICGLLVGGGNYVSKLLLSVSSGGDGNVNLPMALASSVVGIAPIFFIPSVLKGSFTGLGKVGGMLTGLSDKARGKFDKGVRQSRGYKGLQDMSYNRRNRIRAGLDRAGNLTKRGQLKARVAKSGMGKSLGMDRRLAANMQSARKTIDESIAAGAILGTAVAREKISKAEDVSIKDKNGNELLGFEKGTVEAQYTSELMKAVESGKEEKINSAIEAMRSSTMRPKDIAKAIRALENAGKFDGLKNKNGWMRDMYKKYGNDFLASDYELMHFMRSGGANNNGVLGNYGEYAALEIRPDELKPEDFLKMSGDSIAAMVAAGLLNQGMARQILAKNPNISMDKRIMLGAIADGVVTGGYEVGAGGKPEFKGTMMGRVEEFKRDTDYLLKNGKANVSQSGIYRFVDENGGQLSENAQAEKIKQYTSPYTTTVRVEGGGSSTPIAGGVSVPVSGATPGSAPVSKSTPPSTPSLRPVSPSSGFTPTSAAGASGWDSRLSQEQIDDMIASGISEPAGPEYEQALVNYGIVPRGQHTASSRSVPKPTTSTVRPTVTPSSTSSSQTVTPPRNVPSSDDAKKLIIPSQDEIRRFGVQSNSINLDEVRKAANQYRKPPES